VVESGSQIEITMPSILQFVLGTLLSGGIAAVLLRLLGERWLKKVEAKHAAKLESLKAQYANELEKSKQVLQAEIDKTFLVTKVHFETEFQALREVFGILSEIRLELPNLRPHLRIAVAGETREQRLAELRTLLDKLNALHNKLLSASESLSPFYPKEVHGQIEACQHTLHLEITDVILTKEEDQFRSEWFHKGAENLREFIVAYNNVSTLIRERIARLAIVRST
jgi:hypothetical protein